MRTLRRPPSRYTLRRASRDRGKPAAALAIIASIFAIAFVIKLLPPSTGNARLPVAQPTLSSRAWLTWSGHHESVSSNVRSLPIFRETSARIIAVESTLIEPTGDVSLTFDGDPGAAPLIPATPLMALAFPMAIEAVHTETEISDSPLVLPFTKTRSALRVAFVKTGSAIKAAASGTAGVFVSNP